ncbi:MAG: biopolymer transporter ExbD, partial [Verrucomicrobiota bacterium]
MEQQEEPELDMSPLIDVGFLLLIYFLVATTLAKEEADL